MEDGRDPHITPTELLEYFESALPLERQTTIEEHLGECDSCTQFAREARIFEELWRWTADEHGEHYQRALLDRALECAETQASSNLLERLRDWRRRRIGQAEAALRIVLEKSRVAARSIDALSRPAAQWRFELVPQATPIRGAGSEPATSLLLRTEVAPGKLSARVALETQGGAEVVVRVDGLAPGDVAPLVLLVDASSEPPTVETVQIEAAPGLDYGIARFDALPEGEYLLLFAPLDDSDKS